MNVFNILHYLVYKQSSVCVLWVEIYINNQS